MGNMVHLGLSQKLTQSLKMTPEMQLAIKILQLNSLELKDQISEILEANPLIEIDEEKTSSSDISIEKTTNSQNELPVLSNEFKEKNREDYGVDWLRYIEDSESNDYKPGVGSSVAEEENSYENYVSKKENLREHLLKQLSEVNLNQTEQKIGEYIIGLIDRNGYIRYTSEQIAEQLKIDASFITKVLKSLQELEPVGVAAFDLKECLLIQAVADGYSNDAVTILISEYLEDIAQNKIVNIAKNTGYELEEIQAAIEVIKSFNPKPGATFPSASGEEIYVTPEVFIEKVDGEYIVSVNERDMPVLRINKLYREAIKNKDDTEKKTYEFIKSKLDAAQSFLKFIDKRKETILNVTRAICDVQKNFFENGILYLKPLTLQDVASTAGVHESTVSRATNGKFAQTPRGLLELKFFFSGAVNTRGGEDISTMAVKKRIDNLIKGENTKKPLSDSVIVEMLKKDGIVLARRTVAKYREELNIPSSVARKVI